MRSAWSTARWSIQTMMLRAGSSEGPTGSGVPPSPSTTSEQVASKPMPRTSPGRTPGRRDRLADGGADGAPDVGARLLDDRAGFVEDRDVALGRAEHAAARVEDAGAGAAGADVDADEMVRHDLPHRHGKGRDGRDPARRLAREIPSSQKVFY